MKVFLVFLLAVFFTASRSRADLPREKAVPLLVACAAVAYALSTVRFAT